MFGKDKEQYRRFFFTCWEKSKQPLVQLSALERHIVNSILRHSEYHEFFDRGYSALDGADDTEETANLFYHLGLHISLAEQLEADQPSGIRNRYRDLTARFKDGHQLQHKMMECLENSLWQAHTNQQMPDELTYLDCLKRL